MATMDRAELESQILVFLKASENGLNQVDLGTMFPSTTQQQRMQALQGLMNRGKLSVVKDKVLGIVWKATTEPDPTQGLSNEERLVYQLIDEASNMGVWTRDLRFKANLQLTQMNKILKNLENRQLVKAVKSVLASKKKLYMRYDLEPDRSLTGGAWYSESEFDADYVDALLEICMKFIKGRASDQQHRSVFERWRNTYVTSTEVQAHIKQVGISNVQLRVEDVESLLNTLVYDGKIEHAVSGTSLTPNRDALGQPIPAASNLYRATGMYLPPNGITQTPCGVCPVFDSCHDGNLISPTACAYMKDWLEF